MSKAENKIVCEWTASPPNAGALVMYRLLRALDEKGRSVPYFERRAGESTWAKCCDSADAAYDMAEAMVRPGFVINAMVED